MVVLLENECWNCQLIIHDHEPLAKILRKGDWHMFQNIFQENLGIMCKLIGFFLQ